MADAAQTLQMSVAASVIATAIAVLFAFLSARPRAQVAPRFAPYALYRWEVSMRERVIVGLVSARIRGALR